MTPPNLTRRFARRFARLTAGLLLSVASAAVPAQDEPASRRPTSAAPPMARFNAPEARLPVVLQKLVVQAEIAGSTAHTRLEIVLHNPNERVIEGELELPLAAGQEVAGFALDIEGEMRPAVPVEKAKGRRVFDDITRAKVDPALLEAVAGHHFKLRVYPLPARGTRRVTIDLVEVLPRIDRTAALPHLSYRLPLVFETPVGEIDISVDVAGHNGPRSLVAQRGSQVLVFQHSDTGSQAKLQLRKHSGDTSLQVRLPAERLQTVISTQDWGGRRFFHTEIALGSGIAPTPRPAPRRIALLWDASGSGAARDHGRELELLDRYFKHLGQVDVELRVMRDSAEAPQAFRVHGGDWRALRQQLEALAYDGASNLGALTVPRGVELALLFSDGIANYGDRALPESLVPLFAVASAPGSDYRLLRQVAQASGGDLIDLAQQAPAEALNALLTTWPRLLHVGGSGVKNVVAASRLLRGGRLSVAGEFSAPEAELLIEFETVRGAGRQSRTLAMTDGQRTRVVAGRIAARQWASLSAQQLMRDPQRNRVAIRELGLSFGLVTPETSLIVLDTVEDYARHRIEPPPALQERYQALRAKQIDTEALTRSQHLDRIASAFDKKVQWWEKDFPKGERPGSAAADKPTAAAVGQERREQSHRNAAAPPPAPMAPTLAMPPAPPPPVPAMATAPGAPAATIRLQRWQADSPSAARLRAASPGELYATYLDEKRAQGQGTAFYLDAAELFFERGQRPLALRVLSNLAELKLEDRHVLRILAYRLLLADEVKLALPMLAEVLRLAPDEPQSQRDLGLALARNGQWQPAVDALWSVVSQPWHGRFPGIELIALAELNAVLVRARQQDVAVDSTRIDPRLLRNLPLDLRVLLSWDADNTDIDLWVIDPNGEATYFGRRLSYQGGRMSADFTGGYGPEEFSLRSAKPGTYTVRAKFYGHRQQIIAPATTLMLQLSTGFGTPEQADRSIVLRLSGPAQEVTVGSFEVALR